MKLQVINPNTSLAMTEAIGVAARSVARADTEIVSVCPTFGPTSIESFYIVELGKITSKCKTYRLPERKAFSGMFAKFGRPLRSETK